LPRILEAIALAVAAASMLAGCGGGGSDPGRAATDAQARERPEREPAESIAVKVEEVRAEPVSAIYSTSTTLRADRRATVIARTSGVIRRLLVEEGDRVSEGQPLAVLEDDEQAIEAEQTRAAFEIEQQEFERASTLHADDLLSDEAYEAARRELEDARHAKSLAELELERTVIRAPFSGTIVVRHLDVGATVGDGVAVYDLADLDPLYADVNVPERHVERLSPGQTVRLGADASGTVASAVIERIAPAVDPGTGTVKVTLAVNASSNLRPGAFVRAEIVTETHEDAVVVPRSALVAEGRRWNLYRLDGLEERVEQVEVVLGFEEGDRVEIADVVGDSAPVVPGERVVTVGAPALSDGAAVRLVADEREADQEEDAAGDPV
jgi:membrane fusion protein (multidrug efflux system)